MSDDYIQCKGLPEGQHIFGDPPTKRLSKQGFCLYAGFKEEEFNQLLEKERRTFATAFRGPCGTYAVYLERKIEKGNYEIGSYVVCALPGSPEPESIPVFRNFEEIEMHAYRLAVQGGPTHLA